MTGWRTAWALAQITGVVVSTCIWLVVSALWPVAAAVAIMQAAEEAPEEYLSGSCAVVREEHPFRSVTGISVTERA